MSALTDKCNEIRAWLNLGDEVYPDTLVTSWIRMAEEDLSKRLRCKDMVQIDVGLLVNQRYLLPSDWRALDFVRIVDGIPLRFTSRDDFYNPDYADDQEKTYTITGNYLITGVGTAVGTSVELSYYQDLPPLGEDDTWPNQLYPTLYTFSILSMAAKYAIEDERSDTWINAVDGQIDSINTEHARSKASGSKLTSRHRRSFG